MKKFGYFGKPSETEALLTEEAVIYGLMKVQRFVGLPQTGRLDYETIKLLNTPQNFLSLADFPLWKVSCFPFAFIYQFYLKYDWS